MTTAKNGAAPQRAVRKQGVRRFVKSYGNVIIFVAVWLYGMLFVDKFVGIDNGLNIITQGSIAAICCLGMTFVLMTGGIDLSKPIGYQPK